MRITLDASQIDQALMYLSDKSAARVASRALNDASRQGNTAGKRRIRARWRLTAGFINERVRIYSLSKPEDLSVTLMATGRPIDLTHFGARWVRGNRVLSRKGERHLKRRSRNGGVFYEAERGKPGHIPNAFIATVKAGKKGATHMGVFVRAGDARLPIIKKMVITVPSMFEHESVYEAIRKVVEVKFAERFNHHVERELGKFTGPS